MFRRPQYLALIAVVLLVLVVLSLPIQTATQFKLALGGFFLPLIGMAGSTRALSQHAENAVVPLGLQVSFDTAKGHLTYLESALEKD